MPISKNGNLYFTDAQLAKAKQNANALAYAQAAGYQLEKQGHYHVMKDHDSMVFKEDGSWFWNSRNKHGNALDFIVEYEGRSFCEAVLILSGETTQTAHRTSIQSNSQGVPLGHPGIHPPTPSSTTETAVFQLPKRSSSDKQLFGYLCHTRKLDFDIVKQMIFQKILYQSDRYLPDGHVVHNACFVSYDDSGKPCSAFQRGLISNKSFKGEVPGGSKKFGWVFHGKNPTTLYVFEAAIDAASFLSIGKRYGINYLSGADLIALGGLSIEPIQTYLTHHPAVTQIVLMLDNDPPGRQAANRMQSELQASGLMVSNYIPPEGKDWNEYLQTLPIQKSTHR